MRGETGKKRGTGVSWNLPSRPFCKRKETKQKLVFNRGRDPCTAARYRRPDTRCAYVKGSAQLFYVPLFFLGSPELLDGKGGRKIKSCFGGSALARSGSSGSLVLFLFFFCFAQPPPPFFFLFSFFLLRKNRLSGRNFRKREINEQL